MLEQPVPNPLAKNPNVYTHKVFAAVGLILIGTIIAVAGIWWYVAGRDTENPPVETTTTKISTSSAKPATNSATKDETSDWLTYTGKNLAIEFKYPKSGEVKEFSFDEVFTKDSSLSISVKNLPRNTNWEIHYNFIGGFENSIVEVRDIIIDGVAVKISYSSPVGEEDSGATSFAIRIEKNGRVYFILASFDRGDKIGMKLVEDITSTVKLP